jgi:hypothetical protein
VRQSAIFFTSDRQSRRRLSLQHLVETGLGVPVTEPSPPLVWGRIMWLASRLWQKQVISADQLAEAVETQLSRRPSLGSLSIELGIMTIDQVEEVSSAQAEEPDRPFGELALALGFITRAQLALLAFEQAERAPTLGEILVEMGALTPDELRRELWEARIVANLTEELSRELCVAR